MKDIEAYGGALTGMIIGNIIMTGGGDFQSLATALLRFGFGVFVSWYRKKVMT